MKEKGTTRSVKGAKVMAKGSIPGKVVMHPHTRKAIAAVAVNKSIKKGSGGTGNGMSGEDSRY